MKQLIFSVYDQKAHAYLPPFFMHTKDMAVRAFSDAVNDIKHSFGMHPADYTLFYLGIFNDVSGHFEIEKQGQALHNGVELVKLPLDDEQQQLNLEDNDQ